MDITGRPRGKWIIDFGADMPGEDAALYEAPYDLLKQRVKAARKTNSRVTRQDLWWILERPRPAMRKALASLQRYIATPRVAKHRLFVWLDRSVLPDSRLFVFARDDDYFFGVLHSRPHEFWSLRMASWHGVGNDPTYNAESCFETFPFPWPPGQEPPDDPRVAAIAAAARRLVQLRDHWLNPPGATEADLKPRTLTNLYNARPEWLAQAHRALDAAVLAAYGWPADLTDDEILARLLALNHARAAGQ
jgi:type II restriction/modification system DNA methylase subunit YeeA